MTTLHANTKPAIIYPGFLNVSRDEDGAVTITVRAEPREVQASYICGFKEDEGKHGRCTPGDRHCNNYCNSAKHLGPMQAHPKPCVQVLEGAQAQLKLSPEEFTALLADLAKA